MPENAKRRVGAKKGAKKGSHWKWVWDSKTDPLPLDHPMFDPEEIEGLITDRAQLLARLQLDLGSNIIVDAGEILRDEIHEQLRRARYEFIHQYTRLPTAQLREMKRRARGGAKKRPKRPPGRRIRRRKK